MAVFSRDLAFKFRCNTNSGSTRILSEIRVNELYFDFFLLSVNNKSSSNAFVSFEKSISEFNVSVALAERQKERSEIKSIIRAVDSVKYDLLNNFL